ncbi:MAG: hypothetical protein Q7T71_07985 [Herbiconiux sp.]|nr:hypothetical protein [Herbiconiux sp.]
MTSEALHTWCTTRARNLDALQGAHVSVTGGLPGRPSLTTELNHALISRLASELQGFCRDLHDQAADGLLTRATVPDDSIRQILRARIEDGRKLDSGNANAGNLGNDFLRMGLRLWPNIHTAFPRRGAAWHDWVEWLNLARNGIVHNDPIKMNQAATVHPLTLATFRSARGSLNQLAAGMDAVVETYLTFKTGVAPW